MSPLASVRPRSFRLRIALLSTVLSGLVLGIFGAWAWSVVQRMGLDRIDSDIRGIAHRHLASRQPPWYWRQMGESLRFVLAEEGEAGVPFVLLVKGPGGEVLYRSDPWPEEWPVEAFPTPRDRGGPTHRERRGPARPGERDRAPGEADLEPWGPLPPLGPEPPAPPEAGPLPRRRGQPPPPPLQVRMWSLETHASAGHRWRVGVFSNPEVTLVLGLSLGRYGTEMHRLRQAFLLALPAALALIAAGGWWVSRRALRPIADLTRTAEGITARGLDRRIPPTDEDHEFTRLIAVFNGMLDRLERSFRQAVRFSADAAHELKTPLTILQGELELALQEAPAASPQQQTLGRLLDEVQRLKSIVRKLLLLSQADSGQLRIHLEPLDLSRTLEEFQDDLEILAPGLQVEAGIEPDLWVQADPDLLRQAIQNLCANAAKYNRPGGTIRLDLRRRADAARLTIGNNGPGIPESDRDKVFERFYRADKARNRRVDGVGLGLALAREIALSHGGTLELAESREDWTAFTLELPGTPGP